MPVACPLSLIRRVGQVSVNRNVSRLTELRHLRHPVQSFPTALCQLRSYHESCIVDRAVRPLSRFAHSRRRPHQPPSSPFHTRQKGRPVYLKRHRQKSASDSTSLQQALSDASSKGRAPRYYFNANDVSFVPSTSPSYLLYTSSQDGSVGTRTATTADFRRGSSALQVLVARNIAKLANAPDPEAFVADTSSEDDRLLARHGYDVTDVHNWLTILTSVDSTHAARLLTGISGPPESLVDSHSRIPSFIYMMLLRRHHVSPEALRLLISHLPTWHKHMACSPSKPANLRGQESNLPQTVHGHVNASEHAHSDMLGTLFRACMRLFRHARRVWPESMATITHHFLSHSHLSPRAERELLQGSTPVRSIARLIDLFNRALYLISEPADVEPLKSAVHQEIAQAIILRHMSEHSPPLLIKREGYRGVMRVQLAHRKTPDEMEWARLKSPSWPPWKEDRTGMDADIGLEYGVSRARHVLNRMQEAGYSMQAWEHTALVYSGWDSDFSPTIQTRALMPNVSEDQNNHQMWAARVRSTRTLDQAWACFLSFEDQGLSMHQDVYLAMFEKIFEEQKRQRLGETHPSHSSSHYDDMDPLYPGDTREVFSPPVSVHQTTYTKTPPPSVRELHQHMLDHKVCPSGRTLALLLNCATTLEEGFMYLKTGDALYRDFVNSLYGKDKDLRALDVMPDSVFAALIRLLSRFPHTVVSKRPRGKYAYGPANLNLRQVFSLAIYVLDNDRRQFRPAWNALLQGFARRSAPVFFSDIYLSREFAPRLNDDCDPKDYVNKVAAYKMSKHTLSIMNKIDLNLDTVGFRYFCIVVEHAAKATARLMASPNIASNDSGNEKTELSHAYQSSHDLAMEMRQEADYVHNQFWTFVGYPSSAEPSHPPGLTLPRLLAVPGPAILHAYIRALGFLRDYEGLQELVEWMGEHWDELSKRRDIDRNGATVFRRCIVALRVFLEGRWEDSIQTNGYGQDVRDVYTDDSHSGHASDFGAPRECLLNVQDMVEGVEDWDGWASEEEVMAYMERM